MVDIETSTGWENYTFYWENVTAAAIHGSTPEPFHQYSMSAIIPLATFIMIVMILAIGGNSMVILTIIRHKGMRTRTNMFITNLAIADILAAIFDMPVSLVTLIEGRWIFGEAFCQFNGFTVALFLLTSIHTLMYISIHKCMSITRPFSRFMTPRRILCMIIGSWVWSGGYAAAAALGWNKSEFKAGTTQCGPSYPNNIVKMTHSLVNTLFNFIIPLLVMTFCYARIFHEIRHHMQRMRDTSNMDMRNSLLQQKRIAVTLFMVLACFLLCIAPYIGYSCSIVFSKGKIKVPTILNPVAYWFVYTNSACNPIIYAFRSPSFRQGYREIMCGKSAAYLSGESVPNDGGRLSLGNARMSGLRRTSDSSWRKVSLMASWRGYKDKRRAKSFDSAQTTYSVPSSVAAENGDNRESYPRKQCNGLNRFQHFNTIAEASVEDDPSSATSVEKVAPPTIQIQGSVIVEQTEPVVNHISDDCTHLNNSQVVTTSDDPNEGNADLSKINGQEEAAVQENVLNDDNDDAFYDSDVEQEEVAKERSITPRRARRLKSRSCIFHGKESPQNTLSPSPKQDKQELAPITRARSWSESNSRTSPKQSKPVNKTRKAVNKKPLPSPFLWQPSVDYLDVPRHVLRRHGGHSDGDIAEVAEKDDPLPMTKRLTSSFRMLFKRSHEKNLDYDQRSKESSESMV